MFNEMTWRESEQMVQEYMRNKGFKILETNFSCAGVELDIVAILPKNIQKKQAKNEMKQKMLEDKKHSAVYKNSFKNMLKTFNDLLVITEVKGRESDKFGKGVEAISEQKKHNIIRGARFLQTSRELEKYQIRFDVASVDNGEITYIENAF